MSKFQEKIKTHMTGDITMTVEYGSYLYYEHFLSNIIEKNLDVKEEIQSEIDRIERLNESKKDKESMIYNLKDAYYSKFGESMDILLGVRKDLHRQVLEVLRYTKKEIKNKVRKFEGTHESDADFSRRIVEKIDSVIENTKFMIEDWIYAKLEYEPSQDRWSLDIWPYDHIGKGRKTFHTGSRCSAEVNDEEIGKYYAPVEFKGGVEGRYVMVHRITGDYIEPYEGMSIRFKEIPREEPDWNW